MTFSLSHGTEGDQRREAVERLYCEGVPQTRIAQELGISRETLLQDLEVISDGWLSAARQGFDESQARELAKINHLEAVAWQAWERSYRDRETTKVVLQGGEKQRSEKTVYTEAGNPAFLIRISWCIERRCRLLGLEVLARTAKRKDDEPQDADKIRVQILNLITSLDEQAAASGSEESSDRAGPADEDCDHAAPG